MLKLEYLNKFLGFGNEERGGGEYYFSQGMRKEGKGIETGWVIAMDENSSTITGGNDTAAGMKLFNWLDERDEADPNYVYAVDETGVVWKAKPGLITWGAQHTQAATSYGNGLIVDHSASQRVLYAQTRYLGAYDGAFWLNTFKDFGGNIEPNDTPRPLESYEDWIVCGNGSTVALLNITDDSWNASAFTLPPKFMVRDIKAGKNGILIGANYSNKGNLVLWDAGADRAIAPWIQTEGGINSIAKYNGIWIVSAGFKFLITDGYGILDEISPPWKNIRGYSMGPAYPSGMIIIGDYLLVNSSLNYRTKLRQGTYICNLKTRLWEFVPATTNTEIAVRETVRNIELRALFSKDVEQIPSGIGASVWNLPGTIYNSYQETLLGGGTKDYIGNLSNGITPISFLIIDNVGKGNNKKTAEGLIIDFSFKGIGDSVFATPNWTIKAKLYNFNRKLWDFAEVNLAGTAKDKIQVDGSITSRTHTQVGDEITVLQGINAGETKHIISIADIRTNTETWTLDSDLPDLIEDDVLINLCPFTKVGEKTINSDEIKDNRLYIPIRTKIVGRKFLVKLVFETTKNLSSQNTMPLHIENIGFIYNDLGI